MMTMVEDGLPVLAFGRDVVADPVLREAEWLVTNGIGGYASGTVVGLPSRGYHGILVAAMAPPVDRRVLVPALTETVTCRGRQADLSALRWHDGTMAPEPGATLQGFALNGTMPVWRYGTADFQIEKRLWMDHGRNTTRIEYTLLWAAEPVELRLGVISDSRDYHSRSFASGWRPQVQANGDCLTVVSGDVTLHARLSGAQAAADGSWWRGFDLAEERSRGLTDAEDHIHAGTLSAVLAAGDVAQLVLAAGAAVPGFDSQARGAEIERAKGLLKQAGVGEAPAWVQRLVLAADQFIARRTLHDGSAGHTVMAGYHWFADWGRDTMISLPGLVLATGRPEMARSILRAFADVIDAGMVPNRFPDAGTAPEFNTVDATFWFIEAVAAVDRAAHDHAFLAEMFPVLDDIVVHLKQGTRYGIGIDPADGLIRAGAPGVQLTWMDARVGDWVVTPRRGKPIEVNALWVSGLRFLVDAAQRLGRDASEFQRLLNLASSGFARFWNAGRGCCFDVLDGPDGHEALLRPNQIFAARAAAGVLPRQQARQVLDMCEVHLLTPCGLRSLAPQEPGYVPSYGGDQTHRDAAYHQGTVWAWLIGPFIEAHLDLHADPDRAAALLAPLADQLRIGGLGTIGEIFEAEHPFGPRGCIAQAWSVAEVLRAWTLIETRRAQGTRAT